ALPWAPATRLQGKDYSGRDRARGNRSPGLGTEAVPSEDDPLRPLQGHAAEALLREAQRGPQGQGEGRGAPSSQGSQARGARSTPGLLAATGVRRRRGGGTGA